MLGKLLSVLISPLGSLLFPDIVAPDPRGPTDSLGQSLNKRYREVREGEYADEISVLPVSGAPIAVIGVAGAQAVTIMPLRRAFTDRSGTTSATINTSTQVAPANNVRTYFFIQNVGGADIWVNIEAAATAGQPSIKLTPNSSLTFEDSAIPTQAINVLSGTASVAFTAKEAS